jgi:hypothetical protein
MNDGGFRTAVDFPSPHVVGLIMQPGLENMGSSPYSDILQRIEAALNAARVVFDRFTPGAILGGIQDRT